MKKNILVLLIIFCVLIGGFLVFIHFKNISESLSDVRNGLKPFPTTPTRQIITIEDQNKRVKPETNFLESEKPSPIPKTFTPTDKVPQSASTSSKQEDQLSAQIYHINKFIAGTVIDDSDKPIAGALIKISIENIQYTTLKELMKDKVYEEYKSDSQGKFRIQPFTLKGYSSKDNSYVLMITAVGYTGKILGNIKPDKEYLKIILDRGERFGKVLGKVINEKTSEPMSEADVFLFAGGVIPFTQFKSDANGEFIADKLIPGHYSIKAKKGTFGTSYPSYFAISEDEIKDDVVLKLTEAYIITGRVLEKESGLPMADLELRVRSGFEDVKTKTNKEGVYVFEASTYSRYDIRLISDVYIICKPDVNLFDPFGVFSKDYENHYIVNDDIYVTKGVRVSGFVVSPDKKPVKWANLTYVKGGLSKIYDVTDDEGRFSLPVMPESVFQFRARAEGFIETVSEKYLIKDKPVDNIILIMNKGVTLEGKVLVDDSLKSSTVVVGGCVNYQSADGKWEDENFSMEEEQKGQHFKFENVRPGLITLYAMTKEGARSENVELKAKENDYVKDIILKIEPGLSISGMVLKEVNGKKEPAKDTNVFTHPSDDLLKHWRVKTDDTGYYKIQGLKPGYYVMHAYDSGYDHIVKRNVKAGSTDVDFIFKNKEMKISGKVINQYTREPVQSFTIETRPYNGKQEDEKKFEFNDPEGKFDLPQLLVPNSFLKVHAEGYQPGNTLILESKQVYTIALSQYKKAKGRVLSETNNQPISNATVRFIDKNEEFYQDISQAQTDKNGFFIADIFYYKNPNVTILVNAEDYFTKTLTHNIGKSEVLELGDIYLKKKAGKVFGTIYDQYKNPIKNVMVMLNNPSHQQKLTNTNGYYEFTNLNLGKFSIILEEFPEIIIKSELKEEKYEEQIDIYLKETVANFEILLRNQGLRSVNISAESKSFCFRGVTDIDGKFSIKRIPGGDYLLNLRYNPYYYPEWDVLQKVVSIEENKENNFKFEINDSLVSGHISYLITYITVLEAYLISNGQPENKEKPYNQTVRSEEDNYFEFRYLPEGDYIIVCRDMYKQKMLLKKISVGWGEKIDNLQINFNEPALIELLVRDRDTKMPISYAKVSLNDMDFCWTVTDDEGSTTLCGLWEDDYKIKISASDYDEITEEISVNEGEIIKKEILLSKKGY